MTQHLEQQRLPTITFIIAGLAIITMIIWSILQWPAMTPTIVTREAADNHGTSTVSRLVTACAMPAALTALAVLLAFTPKIDARLLKGFGTFEKAMAKNRTAVPRVLGILLIGLSVLLTVLHFTFVSMHTNADPTVQSSISTDTSAN